MGDWCVADHFIVGARAAPKPSWTDPKQWAMRVGVIAPGVQLMQTTEKWSCQRLAGEGVLGMCSVHDHLAGDAASGFISGWNYLLDPACDDDDRFAGVARELGEAARVVSHGRQRALCLREAIPYGRARSSSKLAAVPYLDDPLSKIAALFVRSEPSLKTRDLSLVCGVWTPAHAFVHTGELRLSSSRSSSGTVECVATGKHNLLDAAWSGPCAGFVALEKHQQPVRVGAIHWPFHDTGGE